MQAIFEAVLRGELEVQRLLSRDRGVGDARAERDELVEAVPHWLYAGDTPLHLAAAGLRTRVAALLLKSGANAAARNRRGATALHYACDPRPDIPVGWKPADQRAVIKLLVKNGADVDAPDRTGATPLHRAVRARSAAAVAQLLALGARTDCRLGPRGTTALHLAVRNTGAGGTAGSTTQQVAIIAILLRHGASPRARDKAGRTPLDWANSQTIIDALGA